MSLCFQHYRQKLKKKKEEREARKIERKIKTKKYQSGLLKKWHSKTWKVMSEWVRRKDADWRGYVRCYTCSKILHWKEVQAGHNFHGKLDFDERNLRPQCVQDNYYASGKLNVYTKRLIEENGLSWYEQLERDAARHGGYTLQETMKIYLDLKQKLERL